MTLKSIYMEMQDPLEDVTHRAAAVNMRINASETKVMSTLIPRVPVSRTEPPCLIVSHQRMLISSGTSVLYSSQTARAPKRSEAGLI